MVASFSVRSVFAFNQIQIQPSALEPVESSINIKPLDTAVSATLKDFDQQFYQRTNMAAVSIDFVEILLREEHRITRMITCTVAYLSTRAYGGWRNKLVFTFTCVLYVKLRYILYLLFIDRLIPCRIFTSNQRYVQVKFL